MGSFSFNRADQCTKQANFLSHTDTCKLLIPQEFVEHYGAPFFKSIYKDYGRIDVVNPNTNKILELDVYGFLAYINRDMVLNGKKIADMYVNTDDGWEDTNIQDNRSIGIRLGCYAENHINAKYKLKLCSPSFKGTYEDLNAFSSGDTAQGWGRTYWDKIPMFGTITEREYYNTHCIIR